MKTNENEDWITIKKTHAEKTIKHLCESHHAATHIYEKENGDMTLLVLNNSTTCQEVEDAKFVIANQRKQMFYEFKLKDINVTNNIEVIFRCTSHKINEIFNSELMEWIFLRCFCSVHYDTESLIISF